MDKKNLEWIIIVAVLIFIIVSVVFASFFMLIETGTSPPGMWIFVSLESHEDSWEITIDRISYQERSLSSVTSDRMLLRLRLQEVPTGYDSDLYSRWEMYLKDMEDTWSDEYSYQYDEDITIRMNRVIWNDVNGDGKLSVGDTIVIEKEGGEDWDIVQGDGFYIFGYSEDGTLVLTSHENVKRTSYIDLPNYSEYQIYDICKANVVEHQNGGSA